MFSRRGFLRLGAGAVAGLLVRKNAPAGSADGRDAIQPVWVDTPMFPIMFAAWDVALTEENIAVLDFGTVPIFIRPDNLIEYRQGPIGGQWFAWRRTGEHEEKSTWSGRPRYGHYPGHQGYFVAGDFELFEEPVGRWKPNLKHWVSGQQEQAGIVWCATCNPPTDW